MPLSLSPSPSLHLSLSLFSRAFPLFPSAFSCLPAPPLFNFAVPFLVHPPDSHFSIPCIFFQQRAHGIQTEASSLEFGRTILGRKAEIQAGNLDLMLSAGIRGWKPHHLYLVVPFYHLPLPLFANPFPLPPTAFTESSFSLESRALLISGELRLWVRARSWEAITRRSDFCADAVCPRCGGWKPACEGKTNEEAHLQRQAHRS